MTYPLALNWPRTYADHDGWFIISATREAVGPHDHHENRVATRALRAQLQRMGLEFVEAVGVYHGVEQGVSFVVLGNELTGCLLARALQQESILTRRGLVNRDGKLLAACDGFVYGGEALQQDFHSIVNGLPFSANLRFEEPQAEMQFCDDFGCVSFGAPYDDGEPEAPEPKAPVSYWDDAALHAPGDLVALLGHVEAVLADSERSHRTSSDVEHAQAWHKLRRGLEHVLAAQAEQRLRGALERMRVAR